MSLKDNLQSETVDRLNLREAICISPDSTMREAVEAMRNGRLGCCIVVDGQHKPVGLFTEAILRSELAGDPTCVDTPVSGHMATELPWVYLSDPIETVLEAMEVKNHRFVVVVDSEGRVAGLTGQKGLMEYVADHFPEEVMVQRVGSELYPVNREGA